MKPPVFRCLFGPFQLGLASIGIFASTCLVSPLAADSFSPVYGFRRFDCPGGSDTVVSVPFHATPRWAGRLAGAPAAQGSTKTRLTLEGSPAFAAGELTDDAHWLCVRDANGPSGRYFSISAHGADTVDIDGALAEFINLPADGLISIVPAWTLESLFPAASQTTFHPSTGVLANERGSELLFFDSANAGTDLAPARRFHIVNDAWAEIGATGDAGATLLPPGQAFIVRHREGADDTIFLASQQVFGGEVALAVRVSGGVGQDNVVAPPRPLPVRLDALDLAPFEESASTAPADRKDQLLVFDNTNAGHNKAPSAVYFRSAGHWHADSTGFPLADDTEIDPSSGFTLRKASAGGDGILIWTNSPTYDVTAP